jgi:hypothetical protein
LAQIITFDCSWTPILASRHIPLKPTMGAEHEKRKILALLTQGIGLF